MGHGLVFRPLTFTFQGLKFPVQSFVLRRKEKGTQTYVFLAGDPSGDLAVSRLRGQGSNVYVLALFKAQLGDAFLELLIFFSPSFIFFVGISGT